MPRSALKQAGVPASAVGLVLMPAVMLMTAHEGAIPAKYAAALDDLLGRFRAAWAWAAGHIPEYARYNAALTGPPEPVLRRTYETERSRPVAVTPKLIGELQAAAGNALEFGLLRQPLDVRKAFDTSFSGPGAA